MISSFWHFQFDMLCPQGEGKNINNKIYIYHNFHFYTHSCTSRFGGIIGSGGAMKAISLSVWMRVIYGWYLGGISKLLGLTASSAVCTFTFTLEY